MTTYLHFGTIILHMKYKKSLDINKRQTLDSIIIHFFFSSYYFFVVFVFFFHFFINYFIPCGVRLPYVVVCIYVVVLVFCSILFQNYEIFLLTCIWIKSTYIFTVEMTKNNHQKSVIETLVCWNTTYLKKCYRKVIQQTTEYDVYQQIKS